MVTTTIPTRRPTVRVVGTGGTLASWGKPRTEFVEYGGAGRLDTADNVARIPEIKPYVNVKTETLALVGSGISLQQWIQLANRVNEIFKKEPSVAGVVVTHGTSVLEETAYWLHLTVKSAKPVVVTGTMRPPSAMGSEVDANMFGAIILAAAKEARGKGTMVMLNDMIESAREVTKTNSYRTHTFQSRELGALGYLDSDFKAMFYRAPTRRHSARTEFDVSKLKELPLVDIIYSAAGQTDAVIRGLMAAKPKGIVVAGTGGGYAPGPTTDAMYEAAKKGIAVVACTRAGAGRVIRTSVMKEKGIIAGDNLHVQKARILLMLALTKTNDTEEIQRMFDEY